MGLARSAWAHSMLDAALAGCFNGRNVVTASISTPYPSAACNIAAHHFLHRTACDEILFIDQDIVFTPQNLAHLLSHEEPYVGGIVPKRVLGLEWAIYPYERLAEDPFADGVNSLVDADCGRGFVRIHRSVFEVIRPHVATYQDEQEEVGGMRHEYFSSKPGGHSEDFAFCELYRKLGGYPKVDQRIVVKHVGSATYPIKGTY